MKAQRLLGFTFIFAVGITSVVVPSVLSQDSSPAVPARESATQQIQEPVFGIEIEEVTIPVTVTKPGGEFVMDLRPSDFRILDEDRQQKPLGFQPSQEPLSIAIVIETSSRVDSLLTDIGRSGISFTQLVMGETGEAAVIAFDSEVKVAQDFTENPDLVENTLKSLEPGGDDVRLSDALWRALAMLQHRPDNRRKAIIAISEARDNGSSSSPGFVLGVAQQYGISIYGLTLSTATGMYNRVGKGTPRAFPPGVAALPGPSSYAPTPDTQTRFGAANANLLPLIEELVFSSKNLLTINPLLLFSQGTGAEEFSTVGNAIELALSQIGRELRSQYLITYHPNNSHDPGFHHIRVLVNGSDLRVRTLPGYMGRTTFPSPDRFRTPVPNRKP